MTEFEGTKSTARTSKSDAIPADPSEDVNDSVRVLSKLIGQISYLDSRINAEANELTLDEIKIWKKRCQGWLKQSFPGNEPLQSYWSSIDLDSFRSLPSDDDPSYEWDNYFLDCLNVLKDGLLELVVLAQTGEIGNVNVYASLPEPHRGLPNIDFINDSDIKQLCRQYMKSALASQHSGAYFPAVFQIGAALEGVLLGFANQQPDAREAKAAQRKVYDKGVEKLVSDAPDKWELNRLLEVASELQWINRDGGKKMGDTVRDYRNLIHPARVLKNQVVVDASVLSTCWAGLVKICDELDDWVKTQHSDVELSLI